MEPVSFRGKRPGSNIYYFLLKGRPKIILSSSIVYCHIFFTYFIAVEAFQVVSSCEVERKCVHSHGKMA